MDTRFIQTLLSVVDSGSFAGAARKENMTPAAVAQRIRSIEAELGQRLVTRVGQQVSPTRECFSILPRLRNIVNEIGQIATDLDETGLGGPIRLGSISTALSDRVPNVLAQFAQHAPNANLRIVPGTSKDLYSKLLNEDIDAAFIIQPLFNLPKSISSVHIEWQPFVMIVSADDDRPFEKIISSERALIYDSSSWGGRHIMPWIKNWVPHDKILCELDALEAIGIAVGCGIGYSIVPDWQGLAGLTSVRRIPLPNLAQKRELVLLHRQLNEASVRLLIS